MRVFVVGLVVAVMVGCASGCGGVQGRGIRAYHAGQCSRAMVEFQQVCEGGDCLQHAEDEYILYRGLTHFCLGDEGAARHWLARAKAVFDSDEGAYDAQQRGSLLAAWVSLGYQPGTRGASVLERQ